MQEFQSEAVANSTSIHLAQLLSVMYVQDSLPDLGM